MTQRFKLGPSEGTTSNNAKNNIICRSRKNSLVKTHWPEMGRTHCLTSHHKAPRSATQLSYGIPQYRVPWKRERLAAGKVKEERGNARAQPGKRRKHISHLHGQLEEPLMGGQFLVILSGTESQGSALWGWGVDGETQAWAAKLRWANVGVQQGSGENTLNWQDLQTVIERATKSHSWLQKAWGRQWLRTQARGSVPVLKA